MAQLRRSACGYTNPRLARAYRAAFGRAAFGIAVALFCGHAHAAKATLVYSFHGCCLDGQSPGAPLIQSGQYLYGTTAAGGTANFGTVFRVNPKTGEEKLLYNFQGATDGGRPFTALVLVDGYLYGTTSGYGVTPSTDGTIFKVDAKTGKGGGIYSFQGGSDGANPFSGLTYANGALYGTTYGGGVNAHGTVYKLDLASGAESVVESFDSLDGSIPETPLIFANNLLYGTTTYGGNGAGGVVYSLDPSTNIETVLYSFMGGKDGVGPDGPLVLVNGSLIGTTFMGGKSNLGTVYSVNATTGAEAVLHSFTGSDGSNPSAALFTTHRDTDPSRTTHRDAESCTSSGSKNNAGTLFTIDTVTGKTKVLYRLGDLLDAGADAQVGPLAGTTLYLTFSNGGDFGYGGIYAVSP